MRASLHRYNTRENGFTLVELLIVVLIIGILAAIAIPVYLGLQNQAKNNTAKQDTNSTVHRIQVAITEGRDTAAALTANTDADYRSDGTKVVATIASDNKNYTVTGTQKDTQFTYTYDSKTGQFTEGTANITLGSGSNSGPYTPTGTTGGDGCDMETPAYCNTQTTGLKANFFGRNDVNQASGFYTTYKHGGSGSWRTTTTTNSKVGTQLALNAATINTVYREDLYVLNGGTTFDAVASSGAKDVSVTTNPNPDSTGWTLVQVTYTATATNPRVNVTTTASFPTGTDIYWDDYKVYLP